MLKFKLLTTALSLMAIICFTSCSSTDDGKTKVCDPATCEMAENATEMMCNDSDKCVVKVCAESFKVSEDAKSCEAEAPVCTCDPACKETESCIKGEGDKCECHEQEKPAVCEPACEDGKAKCECANDACACVPVTQPTNECDGKSAGDECAEGKTCQNENSTLVCKDKPAPNPMCEPACNTDTEECVCEADKCECKPRTVEECKCEDGTACPEGDKVKCVVAPVEDKCTGKSEGDECDTNKTCQKGEADKLECKDKPADQTPAEPSEPTEPEEPTEPAQPE